MRTGRLTTWALVGFAAAIAGGEAVPAGAGTAGVVPATDQPHTSAQLESFAGSCSVQGTDRFVPPVTNSAQELSVSYEATGTCTGILNGANVANVPVAVTMAVHSYGSCSQARTISPGQSTIAFADGATIRSTVEYTSMLTEINLVYRGEQSGTAHGHATSLTARTPPDVALKCARGGNAQIPLDLSLTTDSPLVSMRAAGTAGPSPSSLGPTATTPGAGASRDRLRLYVRPRRARVGRGRTFSFRVSTWHGRSVAGAVVRFAGRRARTGPRGVARIIVTLRRPGRDNASATKSGHLAAQHTIVARTRR